MHTPGHKFPLPSPRTLVPAPRLFPGPRPKQGKAGKKSSVFFTGLSRTSTHPTTLLQHPLSILITVPTALPLRVFRKFGCESYCCFCWRLKVSLTSRLPFPLSCIVARSMCGLERRRDPDNVANPRRPLAHDDDTERAGPKFHRTAAIILEDARDARRRDLVDGDFRDARPAIGHLLRIANQPDHTKMP